jgi:hypothetical protein
MDGMGDGQGRHAGKTARMSLPHARNQLLSIDPIFLTPDGFNPYEAGDWMSLHKLVAETLNTIRRYYSNVNNLRITFVSNFKDVLVTDNEEDGFNLVDDNIIEILRMWKERGFFGLITAEALFNIDDMADFLAREGIIFNHAIEGVERINVRSFDGREIFITENGCAYIDCNFIEEGDIGDATRIESGKIIKSLSAADLFPISDVLIFIGKDLDSLHSMTKSCHGLSNFVLPLLYKGRKCEYSGHVVTFNHDIGFGVNNWRDVLCPIGADNWVGVYQFVEGVLGVIRDSMGIQDPRVTFVSSFENVLVRRNGMDNFKLVDDNIVEVLRLWRELGFLGLIIHKGMLCEISDMAYYLKIEDTADFLRKNGIIFNPAVGRLDSIDVQSFDDRERFVVDNGCAYATIKSGKVIKSLSAADLFPVSDLLVFIGKEVDELCSVSTCCAGISKFVLPLLYKNQ